MNFNKTLKISIFPACFDTLKKYAENRVEVIFYSKHPLFFNFIFQFMWSPLWNVVNELFIDLNMFVKSMY